LQAGVRLSFPIFPKPPEFFGYAKERSPIHRLRVTTKVFRLAKSVIDTFAELAHASREQLALIRQQRILSCISSLRATSFAIPENPHRPPRPDLLTHLENSQLEILQRLVAHPHEDRGYKLSLLPLAVVARRCVASTTPPPRPCRARLRLHAQTVSQARSMLLETSVNPRQTAKFFNFYPLTSPG